MPFQIWSHVLTMLLLDFVPWQDKSKWFQTKIFKDCDVMLSWFQPGQGYFLLWLGGGMAGTWMLFYIPYIIAGGRGKRLSSGKKGFLPVKKAGMGNRPVLYCLLWKTGFCMWTISFVYLLSFLLLLLFGFLPHCCFQ